MLAINGMPDHIHMLIGMRPSCCLSDHVREVKKSSTTYIRNNLSLQHDFNWQEGYGAFSYAHSQIDTVIKYINNQQTHHKKKTFREEYMELLKKFEIKYEDAYLFEFYE